MVQAEGQRARPSSELRKRRLVWTSYGNNAVLRTTAGLWEGGGDGVTTKMKSGLDKLWRPEDGVVAVSGTLSLHLYTAKGQAVIFLRLVAGVSNLCVLSISRSWCRFDKDSIQVIVQMESQQQPLNRESEIVTLDPDLEEAPTPIANPPPLLPTKKRKKTSVVWNDFSEFFKEGVAHARCKHCNAELIARSENGTKSLFNHLAKCPKKKNADIRQSILGVTGKTNEGKLVVGKYAFDQEFIREKIAWLIIRHGYPLSIVEQEGFRELLSTACPMYKPVGRNAIRKDILKLYGSLRENMMEMFDKLNCRIAFTTDMWTSNQNKGYMAITAHYIDDLWVLQEKILSFMHVPAPHTAEVLSNYLSEALLEWNLDGKISTITIDNCSTNDSMIGILKSTLLENHSLMLDCRIFHMRCSAHILNLIVKSGFDVIKDSINTIRESVSIWTGGTSKVEKFGEVARQLRIPIKKKLALDCKTRWNSTFHMLDTALKYRDVFTRLKQRERWYNCAPIDDDWDKAKEICDKLKIFHDATELFSGRKYPTASLFFPKICEIRMGLEEWKCSKYEVVRKMADKMLEKFSKYWEICSLVLAFGCVLDPRYKLKLIEYFYPIIYKDQDKGDKECNEVRKALYALLGEYETRLNLESPSTEPMSTSTHDGVPSGVDFLAGFDSFISSTMGSVQAKSELDYYLEELVIPRVVDFDILGWWRNNSAKYPTLSLIARDILAIPVSTVASESTFSMSGRLISDHRSALEADLIEALICSQSWKYGGQEGVQSDFTLSLDIE